MSSKGILIAAIVLAALAGGVYWSQRQAEADKDKPAPGASPKLITFQDPQIKRLVIQRKDGSSVVAERDTGSDWKLTAPETLRADGDAISAVLAVLNGLTWDQLVEEKSSDLSSFGLQAPQAIFALTDKSGKLQSLLVGDEAPAGGGSYAKLANDNRVFTISAANFAAINKSAGDLRDKRLFPVSDKLKRIDIVAKNQVTELDKSGETWQINKPKPVRADGGTVENLIQKIRDAKFSIPADQKAAAATFVTAQRVTSVNVNDDKGMKTAEIRKKGDEYLAHVPEGVYGVAKDVAEGLTLASDDLRNKKLFDFAFNDPSRVEITSGEKHFVFEKSGDTWKSSGKPADSVSVQSMIDKLRDLSATAFPAFGPMTPTVQLAVTSDGGKRNEKVTLSKGAANYVGRREGEPSLYAIDEKAVTELLRSAEDVKEPVKPAAKAPVK